MHQARLATNVRLVVPPARLVDGTTGVVRDGAHAVSQETSTSIEHSPEGEGSRVHRRWDGEQRKLRRVEGYKGIPLRRS